MKNILISITVLAYFAPAPAKKTSLSFRESTAQNIIVITTDGFRWQELFTGADSALINNKKYTADITTQKNTFWHSSSDKRRKMLMPFMWDTVVAKGQLFGNRLEKNYMNTANIYAASYPGYNEILTGIADPWIFNNGKKLNANINFMEFLEKQDSFRNKVAAFTSWNLFPYILNTSRNNLLVDTDLKIKVRSDSLSYAAAKRYLENKKPRLMLLALGETDEFAHSGHYDQYLQQAHTVDSMIHDLWNWTQITPEYKDNTLFIITTDHGRGSSSRNWTTHGLITSGSSQTWMACFGPGVVPLGEVKESGQRYTKQLASAIVAAAGFEFKP